ncbi:MAG TPA: DUF2163 domain-containing protein [Candidatus Sulfotelmatobacter sp.]|jgi:uncharacterized phage protein (TIGR02218 family)|nr:DUF2163 domain-containing protein [Candidatus Sulfotelmatobacter sp.]
MTDASDILKTLLAGGCYGRADLYTIAPVGLETLTLTSADMDVTASGVTYSHGLLRVTRDRLRLVAGLETDTFTLTLAVDTANEMTINGVPFRQAVQWGLLDGAHIQLDWAYIDGWGPPANVVGSLTRFVGLASDIAIDRTGVKITCKSWLSLLDTQVPSQVYQAHCRFMLGDSHCGVDVAGYSRDGTVLAEGSTATLKTDVSDADGTWALGWVSFISGVNKGVCRGVRAQTGGILVLNGPLPWSPEAGDAFTLYPGCDKLMPGTSGASCSAVFNNASRFGGMPYIPTADTAT